MSPQESPQKLDLSQDMKQQGIQLSPREQESFQKYLDSLQAEEKEGIIYITQEELGELKNILHSQNVNLGSTSVANVMNNEMSDFIETQKQEGLSTSDILGKNELLDKIELANIDTLSQEVLFGEDGVFEGIEISDTAQNNMSTSLSLSIIDSISKIEPFTATTITDIFKGEGENYKVLQEGLDAIKNTLQNAGGPDDGTRGGNPAFIAGNGERNFLFMQTEKGKDFFSQVLSGTLKEADIKTFIEAHNINDAVDLPHGMVNALENVGIAGVENVTTLKNKIAELKKQGGDVNTPPHTPTPDVSTPPEAEKKESTGLLRLLQNLLKALGLDGIMEGVFKTNEKADATTQATTETVKKASEEIKTELKDALKKIPEEDLESINPKGLQASLEDPEYFSSIQKILEGIDQNKTANETLQALFGDTHTFMKFSKALKAENNPLLTDIGSHSPAEIFKTILGEYAQYRNNPTVLGKETGRETWAQYATARKQENWTARNGK